MKIGLVCPYNITKGGGVLEIVRATQRELQKRGHTVKMLTPQPRDMDDSHRHDDIIFAGSAADFRSPLHTTSQISVTADLEGIEKILAAEKFDILHFHEPWVPMLSRQILSRSHCVNIATFHAKLPETVMSRTVVNLVTPYTKAVLRNLDELTAVSDAAAEYVRSLTDEPVTIIPNGVDLSIFKTTVKPAASSDKKMILYIGRLEKRKGVGCLLEAFSLLVQHDSKAQLIIAGDGPDRPKLEAQAEELELDAHVTFTGYISDADKLELLATADLFVAPALYGESFGIVLLEAMATGLVTVAGNNPGYASVMQELGSLSLVNPKDPTEFARRMDVMLHDEALRKLWKKWAKEYVKQFAWPHVVDQYVEVYKTAHKRHKAILEMS